MSLNTKKTVEKINKVELKGVSANPPVYLDGTNIALNLPSLFLGNKGSGKTYMLRKVMTLLSQSPLVAKVIVLQKGELADEAMTDQALTDVPKAETMNLLVFD
jgi:ABC-type microcin C transport system duplicated ATPase subunit YejF